MRVKIMLLVVVANLVGQKEDKRRHGSLGKIVHWKLARKCNFEAGDKWYEHELEIVLGNEDYKFVNSFGNYLTGFTAIVQFWKSKIGFYHGIL